MGLTLSIVEFSLGCGGCSDLSSVWAVIAYLGNGIRSSKLGCVEVCCGLLSKCRVDARGVQAVSESCMGREAISLVGLRSLGSWLRVGMVSFGMP